jgi:hypothetical protein
MKYIVNGEKLTAKEWKTRVSMEIEENIEHGDLISDSMLQGERKVGYYIYYTLHIGRG